MIEPVFDRAYPLQDDRAVVQVNGKWGVIDATGRFLKALVNEDGSRQNSYSIDAYGRRQ